MNKRIYRSILLTAAAVFLLSMGLITWVLVRYASQAQYQQLNTALSLASQGVQIQGMGYFADLEPTEYRLTWVDGQGRVLYDSRMDPAILGSHLDREEIWEALEQGYGHSSRMSDSLLENTVYAAKRLPDGTVLRLSVVKASALSIGVKLLVPMLLVLAITAGLAVSLASRLSRQIVEPLNRLNLDDPPANEEYKELKPLFHRMDQQKRQLQSHQTQLMRMQQEFDTVTGSMREGLVLLNNKGQILSLNPAASRLLGIQRSQDILSVSRDLKIDTLLLDALSGKWGERTVELDMGTYQVDASPVFSENCLSGVVLLLFDITQKRQAEAMRREFTANVSHELKIPLQSISGYAELLQSGLVQSQDVIPFSRKIYEEAQHMIRLVADIISLSRLDEGAEDLPRERVDLYALTVDTLALLEGKAQQSRVQLELTGSSAMVTGVRQLLSATVHNLCDNAIKYNRPGGLVRVKLEEQGEQVVLTVSDNGIGIPLELQERIFERFFRADKSHNRQIEGTGLGLSIVKHAVMIHKGSVKLDSQPDQGTAITVMLPKGVS